MPAPSSRPYCSSGAALFNNCDVPFVECVSFDFVEDCAIPPTPPPIFDCEPPFPPPPEVPIPCPEITGNVTVRTKSQKRCSDESSSSSAGGTVTVTKTNNCEFDINIDIEVPIPAPPCPVIRGGSTNVNVRAKYANCISSSASKKPAISVREIDNCSSGSSDNCEFEIDLDLDIEVPIPVVPCPTFSAAPLKVNVRKKSCPPTASNKLTITQKPKSDNCDSDSDSACEFEIDLEIDVPIPDVPCPVINGSASIKKVAANQPPTANLNVTKKSTTPTTDPCGENPETECEFDINIDIEIPEPPIPPCPSFNVSTSTKTGSSLTLKASFTQQNNSSSNDPCEFDLIIDLEIPEPPTPPCPSFNVSTSTKTGSSLNLTASFTQKPQQSDSSNDPCEFDLIIDLEIPEPPTPPCPSFNVSTSVKTGSSVNLTASFTQKPQQSDSSNDPCEFNLFFELEIPELLSPPCPSFSVSTSVKTGSSVNLIASFAQKPQQSNNSSSNDPCAFDLIIDLEIPELSRPPCPSFNINTWAQIGSSLNFTATVNQKTQQSDSSDAPCEFDLVFNLEIPEAPSATPQISAGVLVINPTGVGDGTISITDGLLNIEINLDTIGCASGGDSGAAALTCDDVADCVVDALAADNGTDGAKKSIIKKLTTNQSFIQQVSQQLTQMWFIQTNLQFTSIFSQWFSTLIQNDFVINELTNTTLVSVLLNKIAASAPQFGWRARGVYAATATYRTGDVVIHNLQTWVMAATGTKTGVTPGTNPAWALVALGPGGGTPVVDENGNTVPTINAAVAETAYLEF